LAEYLAAIAEGAGHVLSWPNILIPLLGTLIAMVSSFLPGIGGTSIATIALLMTLHWDPISVLLLFGALTGGATFMGSITAILFNVPGNASAAAAQIDGHPISRMGYPRKAIAAAATASAIGSVIGVMALIMILPVVRPFILQFGPLERLLLGLWGLTAIIAVPNASALRATATAVLGFLLAMVGSDPVTSDPRWTLGSLSLFDGFSIVAVLLGFFTLSELVSWRTTYRLSDAAPLGGERDSLWTGVGAVLRHLPLTFRSSVLGTVVGAVPGVGGTVAGFIAYGQAVQSAKQGDRSLFGKGDIRGLIAPEAAVDAKDGGALLPALAFGIPGSEAGVLLLTALLIHGFQPGLPMLTADLSMSFVLIFALLLSNITTSLVGVTLTPLLAKLTTLRIDRIVLPVLIASLVTLIQLNGSIVDLYVAAGFGVLGYLFRHFDWPRIPFVIAFVLGDFIEDNLAMTVKLADAGRIDLSARPAAWFMLLVILLTLGWMMKRVVRSQVAPRRVAAEGAFALAMAVVPAVMAGMSFWQGYTTLSTVMALLAAGLAAIVVWQLARAPQSWTPEALPVAHRLPLALMATLPVSIWAFGLVAASAAFSLLWVLQWEDRRPRNMGASLAVAAAVAALTALYLDRFAVGRMPDAAILTLF
jgi:putative tricarboxylic transport membrane protein